jgi:glyoxylase-like metal-dependent hydrolase (beta-lactamase superfamily II)
LKNVSYLLIGTRSALLFDTGLPTKHEFRVTQWLNSGEILDLGRRRITVLATPGHTPDSVSLVDPDHHRVFTGDLLNREGTLAAAPGSDIGELAASLAAVVKYARPDSIAYEAHSERPITPKELSWAREHFRQIAAGRGAWQPLCIEGVSTRQFGTGDFNVILPGESGQRLKPFSSLTTEVDPVVGPCPAR